MNVSLTPELETMVGDKVKSGLYNSASEVLREALRLMKEQDQLKAHRLHELRRDINAGITQLDAGQGVAFESPQALMAEVKAEARTEVKAQERAVGHTRKKPSSGKSLKSR